MSYAVKATDLDLITLDPPDTVSEVLGNMVTILNTWKGECPFYRDFGLSRDLLHRPLNYAAQMLQADIINTAARYEPRAEILDISFSVDEEAPDKLVPCVELEVREDGA